MYFQTCKMILIAVCGCVPECLIFNLTSNFSQFTTGIKCLNSKHHAMHLIINNHNSANQHPA